MALSEFEERRIHKVVGDFLTSRRPPPHLRDELDLFNRIDSIDADLSNVDLFAMGAAS